jgi:flagellar hook-associated protein 1
VAISTYNGLNIAYDGLVAQRAALEVTANNIANASTAGYTRQVVNLDQPEGIAYASVQSQTTPGQVPQGVTIAGYQRIRDAYTDAQLRSALGQQASQQTQYQQLQTIEQTIPEPSSTGIQTMLSNFFSSWQALANDPTSLATRQAVAQSGVALATSINTAASTLASQKTQVDGQITDQIGQVNTLATQIASLNQQINTIELDGAQMNATTGLISEAGQAPNALLDQRDKLLDQLAGLGNITVTPGAATASATLGTVSVSFGGVALVPTSGAATTLTRATLDGAFNAATPTLTGGTLHGLEITSLNMLNETDPASYPAALDNLAAAITSIVNTQHQAGIDLNGNAGGNFFDTSATPGVGAAISIGVDPAILQNPAAIAAGAPTQGVGSNTNANAIAALQATVTTIGVSSTTLDGFYQALQAGLGAAAQNANTSQSTADTLVNGLTQARASVSGVSMDEELTNMVKFQNAYSAAARVLTALDTDLQTLMTTGLVGR